VLRALASPTLAGIVIAPSNPWLSVDPMLAVPGLRQAIRASGVPVVAVSPIIGGKAVKGPTAKIMGELGLSVGNAAIAAHYEGLIDALVIDRQDEPTAKGLPLPAFATSTLMRSLEDKVALARQCLEYCDRLAQAACAASAEARS
jgi:LPPG:FO 2-phospho-L-lactate transferase